MGSYSTKPIYIFGGTGFVLMLGGFASGVSVVLMKILNNASMIRNPLFHLTILCIILSILFIQIGILAEIMIRVYHESQNMSPYKIKEAINIKEIKQ